MPLFRAITAVRGAAAAHALSDALDGLDPAPLAGEIHDHDDGSGLWDVGGLFDARPDAVALALLAQAARRAGLRGDESRGPRLGGAGPCRADPGRGRALRRLRQPRPGAHCAEPHRPRDRGGGGLRHRPPRDDARLPPRARPPGTARLRPRRVADIGGGTGVLAMAAASVWPARAVAGDIDPLATRTARANVAANGLADRVACVTAAGFRHPRLRAPAPYGLVFANILAGPLKRMAGDMARTSGRAGGRSCRGSSRGRRRASRPSTAPGATCPRRRWGSATGRRWCCACGAEPGGSAISGGREVREVRDLAAAHADVGQLRVGQVAEGRLGQPRPAPGGEAVKHARRRRRRGAS